MPATENDIIHWQLKRLIEEASELTENELDWTSRLQQRFERTGRLSKREQEILEDIYKKHA